MVPGCSLVLSSRPKYPNGGKFAQTLAMHTSAEDHKFNGADGTADREWATLEIFTDPDYFVSYTTCGFKFGGGARRTRLSGSVSLAAPDCPAAPPSEASKRQGAKTSRGNATSVFSSTGDDDRSTLKRRHDSQP